MCGDPVQRLASSRFGSLRSLNLDPVTTRWGKPFFSLSEQLTQGELMTNRLHFVSGLCLAAVLGMASASAQMVTALGVALPQKFTVSGIELPAGEYRIHELSGSGANKVLLFRSTSGASVNVLAEPITKPQQTTASESSVTLHQVGPHLQLDEVWLSGSEVGYRILSSK